MTLTMRQRRATAPMPTEQPSCVRVTRDIRRPAVVAEVAVPRTRSHDVTAIMDVVCSCAAVHS